MVGTSRRRAFVAIALVALHGCLVEVGELEPADGGGSGGSSGGAGTAGSVGGSTADASTGGGGSTGGSPADATGGAAGMDSPGADDASDVAVDPAELRAHWTFDDGAGSTASDSSGHGLDVLVLGATWVAGKLGGALEFDGVTDYGSLEDPPGGELDFGPNQELSISAWVKTTAKAPISGDSLRIVSKQLAGGALYALRVITGGYVYFSVRDKTLVMFGCQSKTIIADDQWHHVAGTRSLSELRIYVDGVVECTIPATPIDTATSAPVFLGAYTALEQHFQGTLDDVRIYGRALAAAEVASLASQ